MGKGVALQFRQAFPANFAAYQQACRAGDVKPGRMFVFETGLAVAPRYIINFPTKRHWCGKSRYEDIESGLAALVAEVRTLGIASIAIPPLGCGLGGLDWERVRPMIKAAFAGAPDVRVLLYAPHPAPAPGERPVATSRPAMTLGRAVLVKLMEAYKALDYGLTQLEIQKLAYLAQEAGAPLRLRFLKHVYGPYADNLNHALARIEGHFTCGYTGERKPDVEIVLLPGAVEEAERFLCGANDVLGGLRRVTDPIEGFETPYGMELLASVHWVAHEQADPARSEDEAIARVHDWNARKRGLMKPEHIRIAWRRLQEHGWVQGPARCP